MKFQRLKVEADSDPPSLPLTTGNAFGNCGCTYNIIQYYNNTIRLKRQKYTRCNKRDNDNYYVIFTNILETISLDVYII